VALVGTVVSERHIASIIIVLLRSVLQLLVTPNVPNYLIFGTLTMGAIRSSETSVPTRAAWHHIPEETLFFVVTAVKTSNLTSFYCYIYTFHVPVNSPSEPKPKFCDMNNLN
jgi:hypothetical protein